MRILSAKWRNRLAGKDRPDLLGILDPSASPVLVIVALAIIWMVPYGPEGPGQSFVALEGSTLICALFGFTAIVLHLLCGRQYSAVFIQAAVVRLIVLAVFYSVAPEPITFPLFNINTPTLPVWDDDVHYVGAGQYIVETGIPASDIINENPSLPFAVKVARVGLFVSWTKSVFGDAQVWVRLVNIMLGSITALLVVLSLRGMVGPASQRFGAMLVVAGPEFIQSSILLYKEVYVHLSVAILLYGLWKVARDRDIRAPSVITAFLGLLAIWWCRQEVFMLAFGVTAVHFFVFAWKGGQRYGARIAFGMLAGILLMSVLNIGPKAEMMQAVLEETSAQQGMSFGWASSLSGPARLLHIPISFANPPPFLFHQYFMVDFGDYLWFKDVFRELRTVQWWWMMPWVAVGLLALWNRSGRLATFALPYLCVWFSAAIAFNGVGPEVVRYRDTFLPCAVILAMLGHDYAGKRYRRVIGASTIAFLFGIWVFMNVR